MLKLQNQNEKSGKQKTEMKISTFPISAFCFGLSIFKPVINGLDDFILEGDEAFLIPPPVVYFVADRIHGADVYFYRRVPEFAAGVKQFGGDDD
jgi:hypothetical protein